MTASRGVTSRKVVGGLNSQASELAATLYGAIFNRVVPVSSPAVAEMTKLLENIYRCVNIALVNELKLLSLRMGLDIWEVIDAASTKPFGFSAFLPWPGLGGTLYPRRSLLSHGKPRRRISRHASSNWPERSTMPCPIMWSNPSARLSINKPSRSKAPKCWCWGWPTRKTSMTCASLRP